MQWDSWGQTEANPNPLRGAVLAGGVSDVKQSLELAQTLSAENPVAVENTGGDFPRLNTIFCTPSGLSNTEPGASAAARRCGSVIRGPGMDGADQELAEAVSEAVRNESTQVLVTDTIMQNTGDWRRLAVEVLEFCGKSNGRIGFL